jgi:hypothetical protein
LPRAAKLCPAAARPHVARIARPGDIGPVEIRVIEDRAAKIGAIELRRPPPRMA